MLPPLTLAYIGDGIFEMLVREKLVTESNLPNGGLHAKAKEYVSAHGQAALADIIIDGLSEEEAAIYKRGRNSHAVPSKNAVRAEYVKATGLEALFGYLYLREDLPRIGSLFDECVRILLENRASL